ncbi:DUF4343 domain-containing protein [bacterium]|nr:DUF4343 domain-containing protein [bacterium]
MQPVLLFRKEFATKYELRHAEKYFPIHESRVLCRDSIVIGRYSVLPFYEELEHDLHLLGSRLINSLEEHNWISTFAYYEAMKDFTPETWDETNFHQCNYQGPFVVKGKMKSKKHDWRTKMFAETKRKAIAIGDRLKEDSAIHDQGIVYRKFVPLKTYELGVHGLPHTNEWRFFFLKERLLSYGYYWSLADSAPHAELKPEGKQLAEDLAKIAAKHATFFVLDIAETADGRWILIEINDGQQSVPSENDLDQLYGGLKRELSVLEASR